MNMGHKSHRFKVSLDYRARPCFKKIGGWRFPSVVKHIQDSGDKPLFYKIISITNK